MQNLTVSATDPLNASPCFFQIASFVNKTAMDTAVLQRSLAILESMVLNSQDLYHKVAQEITIGQLIPHLQGYVNEAVNSSFSTLIELAGF